MFNREHQTVVQVQVGTASLVPLLREIQPRHLRMHLRKALVAYALLHATAMASRVTRDKPSIDSSCPPKPQGVSIGERASCTFSSDTDVDPSRIPSELPTAKCNCVDTLCRATGDYRCQEVRSTFQVVYPGSDGCSSQRNGTVELPTSCVCVAGRSGRSASAALGRFRSHGRSKHGMYG